MPYIIRPPRQLCRIAAGLLSSAAIVGAAPAVAAASCPSTATSHPFAQYGDNAAYTLVQGGTFESGAPAWSLTRSEVISENSPLGGSHALQINAGGRAVSPGFCASMEYPSFRFFLRRLSGGGKLYVNVRWEDESGVHEASVASLEGGSSWTLSPVLALAENLPLSSPEESISPVKLVFSTSHPGLSWAIDAVYVDPYSR
jgi:hypothetical protein